MVGGAAPYAYARPQVSQEEANVGIIMTGKRVKTWSGGKEKREYGRTAWQKIVGCMASGGTGVPPQ